jgi:hypothetical protein
LFAAATAEARRAQQQQQQHSLPNISLDASAQAAEAAPPTAGVLDRQPLSVDQWLRAIDAAGRVHNQHELRRIIFYGVRMAQCRTQAQAHRERETGTRRRTCTTLRTRTACSCCGSCCSCSCHYGEAIASFAVF